MAEVGSSLSNFTAAFTNLSSRNSNITLADISQAYIKTKSCCTVCNSSFCCI